MLDPTVRGWDVHLIRMCAQLQFGLEWQEVQVHLRRIAFRYIGWCKPACERHQTLDIHPPSSLRDPFRKRHLLRMHRLPPLISFLLRQLHQLLRRFQLSRQQDPAFLKAFPDRGTPIGRAVFVETGVRRRR